MARCKCIVVVEHRSLQFDVFPVEWQGFRLLLLLDQARRSLRKRWNIIHIPDVTTCLGILVPVDLGLFERPFWQRRRVRPHSHLGRVVDEFELPGHGFERRALFALFEADFEERVVEAVSRGDVQWHSCEFLVRGVIR